MGEKGVRQLGNRQSNHVLLYQLLKEGDVLWALGFKKGSAVALCVAGFKCFSPPK